MKRHVLSIIVLMSFSGMQSCQRMENDKSIEAISIGAEVNKDAADHALCSSLSLKKEDVEAYFAIAGEVNEQEFHQDAVILPCKYKGAIKIRGEMLQWEIYAGGAGYLYNGKSVNKRFLCKGKCCNSLSNLC